MKLFFNNMLTAAVYSYSKELDAIAKTLGKILKGSYDNAERDFISGYKDYDSKILNQLVEKAMTKALGSDSYSYELEKYLEKFGIKEDLSMKSDSEVLRIVSRYRDEIKRLLSKEGIL